MEENEVQLFAIEHLDTLKDCVVKAEKVILQNGIRIEYTEDKILKVVKTSDDEREYILNHKNLIFVGQDMIKIGNLLIFY